MLLRLLSYVIPSFLFTYSIWYLLNPSWFNYFCIISFLLIISWTMGYFFYEIFNQENINPKNKIVLVTGCDSGFGNRLVAKLDNLGFHVYAGVLFPDGKGAQQLREKCSNRLKIVKMDVTSANEVNDVVEQIKQTEMPLWAIVNNAGIGISAPFDWGNDVDAYNKIFDVNVIGVVRVSKSCINLLRQSKGRIVNVASIAGRLSGPWITHYSMAKHSVRVFSDAIRRELTGSGIKIVTLEPSFFRTQIVNFDAVDKMREKIYNETPEEIRHYYGENFLKVLSSVNRDVDKNTHENIDEVVDSMINGIMRKHPKLFYRCGSYSELFALWGASHMPEILVDAIVSFYLDKKLLKYKAGLYQPDKKFD